MWTNYKIKGLYEDLFDKFCAHKLQDLKNNTADAKAERGESLRIWHTKKGDFIIKTFSDDDEDYNRLCAEELADHINENY